jgi:hypothetical protein
MRAVRLVDADRANAVGAIVEQQSEIVLRRSSARARLASA